MNEADIAARLVGALSTSAAREAGSETALVSVTVNVVANGEAAAVEASLVRQTRTLLFMSAELRDDAGRCIATAASVHRVLTPAADR